MYDMALMILIFYDIILNELKKCCFFKRICLYVYMILVNYNNV